MDVATLPARHKLSVDDYYRMADAGILGPDDRVELIEGEVIDMAPIGQGHSSSVGRLTQALVMAFGPRGLVWVQCPIRLDRFNDPQPDFAVLRPRADYYGTGERPGPADVMLLIEVSDSSLRFDREVKRPLYSRAGIPELWIVDVRGRAVEVHRGPREAGYAEVMTVRAGEVVAPLLAPDVRLDVARDILG